MRKELAVNQWVYRSPRFSAAGSNVGQVLYLFKMENKARVRLTSGNVEDFPMNQLRGILPPEQEEA